MPVYDQYGKYSGNKVKPGALGYVADCMNRKITNGKKERDKTVD